MEYEVSWMGLFSVSKTWIQRMRFAICDQLLPFPLRRGFHWAVPWIGRTVTGSAALSLHSTATWVWQGDLFALWCFFVVLLKMTRLFLPANNKKESEENEILLGHFPYMEMLRGLIKREKTYDLHSWYFPAVLFALRALFTCWNTGRFQRADEVSLPQTDFSSHLSYWIIEGTIKGKG